MRAKPIPLIILILSVTMITFFPAIVPKAHGDILANPTNWSPWGPRETKLSLWTSGSNIQTFSAIAAGNLDIIDVSDANGAVNCAPVNGPDFACANPAVGVYYWALKGWDFQLVGPGTGSSLVSEVTNGFATNHGFWSALNMRQVPGYVPVNSAFTPGCLNPPACTMKDPLLIRRSLTTGPGGITSLSPFFASSSSELEVLSYIFDPMLKVNPETAGAATQIVDWMTNKHTLSVSGGSTVQIWNLRSDIYFQGGPTVTAADVCFTIQAYMAVPSVTFGPAIPAGTTCATASPKVAIVTIPMVLPGPTPCCELAIGSLPILREATWLGPCSFGGVLGAPGNMCAMPGFDPMIAGLMEGSGPWVCESPGGVPGGSCTLTPASPPCFQPGGIVAGQGFLPGGRVCLKRYDLTVDIHGYMRCCPNQQGSNLHRLSWLDGNDDGQINILDVASMALVFGMHSAHWDSPIFGITNDEVVNIVEIAQIAFVFDSGTTRPYTSATLVNIDPEINPYEFTIAGTTLFYQGFYKIPGGPAEVELSSPAPIPAGVLAGLSVEIHNCLPDCPTGALINGPVGGAFEAGVVTEGIFNPPGVVPCALPCQDGVWIASGGVLLDPYDDVIAANI